MAKNNKRALLTCSAAKVSKILQAARARMPKFSLYPVAGLKIRTGASQAANLCSRSAATIRWVKRDDLEKCSALAGTPTVDARYLVRVLMRNDDIQSLQDSFLRKSLRTMVAEHSPFSDFNILNADPLYVRYCVGQLSTGRLSLDALYSDLFRLLQGTAVLDKQSDLFAFCVLKKVVALPAFELLRDTVHGDMLRAGVVARMLMESLLASDEVQRAAGAMGAKEFKQQKEKQEDEAGESGESDEQDGENDSEDDRGSEGKLDATQDSEDTPGEQSDDSEGDMSDGSGEDGDGQGEASEGEGNDAEQGEGGKSGGSAASNESSKADSASEAADKKLPDDLGEEAVSYACDSLKEMSSQMDSAESMSDAVRELIEGATPGRVAKDMSRYEVVAEMANRLADSSDCLEDARPLNVFRMLGRMESLWGEAASVSQHGDGDMVDVVQGGDLAAQIPAEMVEMAVPELEYLHIARMADEQLLQLQRRGIGEAGSGPLIIMLDRSGSMNADTKMQVDLHTVCAALALSAVRYATKWDRDVAILPFDTEVDSQTVFVLERSARMPFNEVHQNLQRALGAGPAGGTNFISPLNYLARMFKQAQQFSQGDWEHADVLYITDGQAWDSGNPADEIRQMLPNGTRLIAFIVSTEGERNLRDVIKNNEVLFDAVVGCHVDNLQDGIKELVDVLIRMSFYDLTTKHDT